MAKSKAKPKSKAKSVAKAKAKPSPKRKVQAKSKAKVSAKTKSIAKPLKSKAKKPTAKPAKKSPSSQPFAFLRLDDSKPTPATQKKLKNFVTPLDDRLLVEVSAEPERTAGGLYLPTVAEGAANHRGRVISTGRGHMDKKGKVKTMDVKVGDEVLFPRYAGTSIVFEHQEFWFLREADLLGIVDKG